MAVKKAFYTQAGFSLVEMLVAVGLMAIVLGATVGLFAMVITNNQKTDRLLTLRKEGDNAAQIINRIFTGTADYISSTANELVVSDLVGKEYDISCIDNGDDTYTLSMLTTEGVTQETVPLINSNAVSVTGCSFTTTPLDSGNSRYMFEFAFTLQTTNNETETFYTKAVMRNVDPT